MHIIKCETTCSNNQTFLTLASYNTRAFIGSGSKHNTNSFGSNTILDVDRPDIAGESYTATK